MTQIYGSRSQIGKRCGYSSTTVRRIEEKMRKLIPLGIYDQERDFLGTHIRIAAVEHYIKNRKALEIDPMAVEPFIPKEV